MIHSGQPPHALRMPQFFWRETGSLESYQLLHGELRNLEENVIPPLRTGEKVWLDPEAEVSPASHLRGYVSIGRGTRVGDGAEVEDSVLWDDVEVHPQSKLRNCIVGDGVEVAGLHENEILIGSVR
jgi:NDP-sugar pyrophosphorylase family protein